MLIDKSVVIAGGGIGGLACALAVGRSGVPVTVLEQAAQFDEVGAGGHRADLHQVLLGLLRSRTSATLRLQARVRAGLRGPSERRACVA